MATRTGPQAGGFILALAILIGAFAGAKLHEPSIGILIGAGIGLVVAILVWAIDRRRNPPL